MFDITSIKYFEIEPFEEKVENVKKIFIFYGILVVIVIVIDD